MELDQDHLAEVAQATVTAMDAMAVAAQRLAAVPVTGSSPDGRIQVRVNASGRVVALRLHDGVLRRYDSTALGEQVTRTIRRAQIQARDAYDQQIAALLPPEVAASEAELQRIWRE
jgi:DNA-binding protein YbaB